MAASPSLPTFAEQGLSGYKLTNNYRLFVPAGTPRPVINAINRVVSDGMHSPAMAQKLAADGAQPGVRATTEEIRAEMARDFAELEQQVKKLNIKLD